MTSQSEALNDVRPNTQSALFRALEIAVFNVNIMILLFSGHARRIHEIHFSFILHAHKRQSAFENEWKEINIDNIVYEG